MDLQELTERIQRWKQRIEVEKNPPAESQEAAQPIDMDEAAEAAAEIEEIDADSLIQGSESEMPPFDLSSEAPDDPVSASDEDLSDAVSVDTEEDLASVSIEDDELVEASQTEAAEPDDEIEVDAEESPTDK
ncbi:MAG: hypothetical protein QNJ97_14105 [Myxococcota bacterium]|nr:hypothetical protein [Myxococcota bacterium]